MSLDYMNGNELLSSDLSCIDFIVNSNGTQTVRVYLSQMAVLNSILGFVFCLSVKAVCCADMQHCCPAGYKCGPGGTCISAGDLDWSNWVNWKLFFSKKKRAIPL